MLVRREVVNGCTLHSQRPNAGGLFLDQDIHDRQHDAEKEVYHRSWTRSAGMNFVSRQTRSKTLWYRLQVKH